MLQSQQRALKRGLSKRMTREAENRRCPKCGRGYAIDKDREELPDGSVAFIRWCRWDDCDYEKVSTYRF